MLMPSITVTTVDNPIDWFEDPITWDQWDRQHGYWTSNRLARIMATTAALGEVDEMKEYEWACRRLAELCPYEYIVVTHDELKEMLEFQRTGKRPSSKKE